MRTWMIAWSWIDAVTGLIGVMPAMFSPMVFTATAHPRAAQVAFWSIATYPPVCGAALALGWLLYSRDLPATGVVCIAAPVVNVAIGSIALRRIGGRVGRAT